MKHSFQQTVVYQNVDCYVLLNEVKEVGTITIIDDDFARITLTSTTLYDDYLFPPPKIIPLVVGAIKINDKKVKHFTLYDCSILGRFISGYGLYQYEILSSLIIIGVEGAKKESCSIDNLCVEIPGLTEWIGKGLIQSEHNLDTKESDYHVLHTHRISYNKGSILESIVTYMDTLPVTPRQTNIEFHQRSYLKFKFDEELPLIKLISFVRRIENFFSFLFSCNSISKEIFTFYTEKNEEMETIDKALFWFSRHSYQNTDFSLRNVKYRFKDLSSNFDSIITKWNTISDSINILDRFFYSVYNTNFIDQKIILCLNLIEVMHKYKYGTNARPIEDHNKWVEKIVNQIENNSDKRRVRDIIQDKNGFGLTKKLITIVQDVGEVISNEKARRIISFRSSFAHGGATNSYEIDELIDMYEFLFLIIHKWFVKELGIKVT